jgi:hypothetical protein
MASLAQQAALAASPLFAARVQAAIVTAAADILAAAQGDTGANTFALRTALAAQVMQGVTPALLSRFCWAAATSPSVTQDIPPTGYAIAAAQGGMPAQITTTVANGFASGWNIEIDGCLDPVCNGTWVITVIDTTDFTIPVLGSAYVGPGGTATLQPSDTDINSAVAAAWSAVAGVNANTD